MKWWQDASIAGVILIVAAALYFGGVLDGRDSKPDVIVATDDEGATVRWSAPGIWRSRPPREGDSVLVPAGVNLLLDVAPPPLATLTIEGRLVFAHKDIELRAESVLVYGSLEIGTPEQPFIQKATITLTGPAAEATGAHTHDTEDLGKGISVLGGRLELHGEDRGVSWTRLGRDASPGDSEVVLTTEVSWRPGDVIVIAPTGPAAAEAEEMVIEAVEGARIKLVRPLLYKHLSDVLLTSEGVEVPRRAEVGLLSRSITIRGDESSAQDGYGGHLLISQGSQAHISWVEFASMGQAGRLARYPVHFHLGGDMSGSYVENVSIHHSFNRCLTIHGTLNLVVSGNVAYDAIGHCYFFEDGIESGNLLQGNLGLLTRAPAPEHALLKSDLTPATFWLSNPDNKLLSNVAAGSEGYGFWLDPPLHPTGLSKTEASEREVWPRHLPLVSMDASVAHSNTVAGFFVGRAEEDDDFVVYSPRLDGQPGTEEAPSASVTAYVSGLVAYSNPRLNAGVISDRLVMLDSRLDVVPQTLAPYRSLAGLQSAEVSASYIGERFYWLPAVLRGEPGQSLTLVLRNETTVTHNFSLAALGIDKDVQTGSVMRVEVGLPQTGSLLFRCVYHQDLGMRGELVAGDAVPSANYGIYGGGFSGY